MWPITRDLVKLALSWMGISPLKVKVLASSGRQEWQRMEVLFSIRVMDHFKSERDLCTHLGMSFVEPISDLIATSTSAGILTSFTIYGSSNIGRATYRRRMEDDEIPWDEWMQANM